MREVKPLKVEFIDKDTMCRADNLWNIVVELNTETSELVAWYIGETPDLDKKLEIKVVE
jgi:hypothetical protein